MSKAVKKARALASRPLASRPNIFFVGSGPGDPELITVRGMMLLKKADIVVYTGSLVQETTLKYCRKRVKVYNSAGMHLDEIMDVMMEGERRGSLVVRLHTGDVSLYSAFREQADILDKNGIEYGIVPGVSSAFGAAAALGREFTAPGATQTVIFTRIEGRTPVPASESLSSLSKHLATMCIFLSVGMIDRVVKELKSGYPLSTPVSVVYRATWADELIVTGTLKDIAAKVKKAGIERHGLILVGRAIGSSPVEKSKLYDKDFKHGCRK